METSTLKTYKKIETYYDSRTGAKKTDESWFIRDQQDMAVAIIGMYFNTDQERESMARLLSAAPEMIEALKAFVGAKTNAMDLAVRALNKAGEAYD